MNTLGAIIAAVGSKLVAVISGLLAVTMISYSGYVIYDSVQTERAAFSSWDLSSYRPVLEEDGSLSFDELLELNEDTVGWLKIDGTNIDYPVVQGVDDIEYAHKDVFGNNSLTGSIYLTTANTRDFTNSFNLIYGHHMANGAMFGDIEKYEDADFFHNHQDGILITTIGVYDLHVFARISTDAYDSRIYSAGDRKSADFPDFLLYVQSLAVQWQDGTDVYDITDHIQTYLTAREANIAENGEFVFEKMPREAVENGMQLLALSTCADTTTNGRQVLFATMKIRTDPLPAEVINDEPVPLAARGHGQSEYWGVINLLCAALTVYFAVPVFILRSKFGRSLMMKKANRDTGTSYYDKRLRTKIIVGAVLEAALAVGAVVLFARTESFHNPMTIIDEYTPYMIGILAATWLTDVILFRYRSGQKDPEGSASAA